MTAESICDAVAFDKINWFRKHVEISRQSYLDQTFFVMCKIPVLFALCKIPILLIQYPTQKVKYSRDPFT